MPRGLARALNGGLRAAGDAAARDDATRVAGAAKGRRAEWADPWGTVGGLATPPP
jgi:hypothetical protein